MRTINLVSVTLEQFRSFRQPTTIRFSRTPGFKFMTGRNEAEPALGANGAGKSTLWDGLAWINFGSSVKDQRASDLVTWGGRKPRGACVWDIDGEQAIVERTGNPNYLALNGQTVEQSVIDRLLGRTKKQFVQSVIWGQGAKTLIDLSIPERAAVLDDVLDLGLWLSLSDAAGKKISVVEREIEAVNKQIAFEDGRLASIPDEAQLILSRDTWQAEKQIRIAGMIAEVESAETVMADLIEQSEHLISRVQEHDDIEIHQKGLDLSRKNLDAINQKTGSLLAQVAVVQKTIDFFSNSPTDCPTCNQRITIEFARTMLKDDKTTMANLKDIIQRSAVTTHNLLKTRDDNEAAIDRKRRIREHLNSQVRETQLKLEHQQRTIKRMADEIDRFGNEINPWLERIEHTHRDQLAIAEQRALLITQKQTLEANTLLDGFWRDGFKRVRLFEINRILAHLELEIENAAGILGLFNWRINVTTETENKSGGARYGVQIQITSPEAAAPWESWSGGEGQRIRLAVALGFAGLIERMTAVRYGIEVWDEPSSFLSPEGIDDFLACMRLRAENEHKSLFLIDCGIMT